MNSHRTIWPLLGKRGKSYILGLVVTKTGSCCQPLNNGSRSLVTGTKPYSGLGNSLVTPQIIMTRHETATACQVLPLTTIGSLALLPRGSTKAGFTPVPARHGVTPPNYMIGCPSMNKKLSQA